MLHALGHVHHGQHFLALLQLQLQMCGNSVDQAAVVFDAVNGGNHFAGDFFVQLGELIELRQQSAAQGFAVVAFGFGRIQRRHMGNEMLAAAIHVQYLRPLRAFHQHFDRAVRQLQHL